VSDARKTLEVLLTGRDQASPAIRGVKAAVSDFADSTIGSFKRAAGAVVNFQNLFIAGTAAIAARSVFKPAIEMETYNTQLAVLLGGLDQAKTRMADLASFAETTPFELPEIVQASKTLEVLTQGALSTRAGLTLVGNAAAAGGQSIQELSVWFGRLYDGIQSGRPVGEAMMRLQELGIITGAARGRIADLQKTNASASTVWSVVTREMDRYNGMMEKGGATTAGRLSTLSDSWEAARRDIGEAALPALSKAVEDLIAKIDELRASGKLKEWGEQAGAALEATWNTIKGIATFIEQHRDALTTLGFTYAGMRILMALRTGILGIGAALDAYAAAQLTTAAATTAATAAQTAQTAAMTTGTAALAGTGAAATATAIATNRLTAAVSLLKYGLTALASSAVLAGIALVAVEIYKIKKACDEAAEALKRLPGATGSYTEVKEGWGGFLQRVLFGELPPAAGPSTANMQGRMKKGQSPYHGENTLTVPAPTTAEVDKASAARNAEREQALFAEIEAEAKAAAERAAAQSQAEADAQVKAAAEIEKAITDAIDKEIAAAKTAAQERQRALDQIADDDRAAEQERLQHQIADARAGADARIRANQDAAARLKADIDNREQTLRSGEAAFRRDQYDQRAAQRADQAFETRIRQARGRVYGNPSYRFDHGQPSAYDRALVQFDTDRRRAATLNAQIKTAEDIQSTAEVQSAQRETMANEIMRALGSHAEKLPAWLERANPSEANRILHLLLDNITIHRDHIELNYRD